DAPQPSHRRRTTACVLPSQVPDLASSLRENNQRPNETVLTPSTRQARTTSQQRSTLPASRQGHDLSPGLTAQGAKVLTCRRLPGTESAVRQPGQLSLGGPDAGRSRRRPGRGL